VTPRVVRRWLSLGLTPGPPWTLQQSHNVRDMTDTQGRRRRGPQVAHGTMTRWNEGCSCNPMSPGPERRCQGPRTSPSAEAATSQPRCGSSCSTPSTAVSRSGRCFVTSAEPPPGLGIHQDRPGMVGEAGGCSKATVVRTFSTAPTLPTFTAVSAGSVGLTRAGGWLEIAGREDPPR
jgi:hypothetical protein